MKPYTLIFIALALFSFAKAQNRGKFKGFDYNYFSNQPELSLVGNAYSTDGQARLVESENWQSGAMWYNQQMLPVQDEFTTEFEFRISKNCQCKGGADGVVLVIHTNDKPDQLGRQGEGIGYAGIPNSLAVEFDAFDNDEGSDHHVAIHSMGASPNSDKSEARLALNHALPNLKTGSVHKVRIQYERGRMKVMMDDMSDPLLDAYITLDKIIDLEKGHAWMGITSATGGSKAQHDILSWSFKGKSGKKKPQPSPSVPVATATPRPAPRPEPRPSWEMPEPQADPMPAPEPSRSDMEDEPLFPMDEMVTTLEGRPVTPPTRLIEVQSKILSITLWDHNKKDGDIVSMNLNGVWVINEVKLKHRKQEFEVRLSEENNQLILYAHNLGDIPPNTASIAINDGVKRSVFVLTSNMGASSSVAIRYRPQEDGR